MGPATLGQPLPQRQPLPWDLALLAVLFLLGGLWSFVPTLQFLMAGKLQIDWGILGVPIFFGLRAWKRDWRYVGLVFAWVFMLWAALQTAIGLVAWTLLPIKSLELTPESPLVLARFFGRNVLIFLAAFWVYRVLTRPKIRERFLA